MSFPEWVKPDVKAVAMRDGASFCVVTIIRLTATQVVCEDDKTKRAIRFKENRLGALIEISSSDWRRELREIDSPKVIQARIVGAGRRLVSDLDLIGQDINRASMFRTAHLPQSENVDTMIIKMMKRIEEARELIQKIKGDTGEN